MASGWRWNSRPVGPCPPAPRTRRPPTRRLADCARGLAHVHRLGWVHRDLKPANLLLRADGAVVLGDFGSACPIGTTAPRGTIVGTPLYASPESEEAGFALPAADVYALGALLHEWLTDVPPFAGRRSPSSSPST